MKKGLNSTKNKLIIALKRSLEEKKRLKLMQEYSVAITEQFIPLFDELKTITEKAEAEMINSELKIRSLEDTLKELAQLQTIHSKEEEKEKKIISVGTELLSKAQKTRKEEEAVVENISRRYDDIFERMSTNFNTEYKILQKKIHDSTNGFLLTGSELLSIIRKSGKVLKWHKAGNDYYNHRNLYCYG